MTGAVLIYSTFDMPDYGDPNAPINRHVAPVYLRDSERQTGVPNVVTAVLASYRGYDTLGETTVIFTAACGVLVLLGRNGRRRRASARARAARAGGRRMTRNPILRIGTKLLMPAILLFALYVQFHGDFGPGGGFQAGVIFAAGFILYALLFGVGTARRVAPAGVIRATLAAGVLIYAGIGVAGAAARRQLPRL